MVLWSKQANEKKKTELFDPPNNRLQSSSLKTKKQNLEIISNLIIFHIFDAVEPKQTFQTGIAFNLI